MASSWSPLMRPPKFTPPLIIQLPFSRSCSIAPKTDPDRARSNCSVISHCSPSSTSSTGLNTPPPVEKKRKRYRKLYPGEAEGITEEMRFVAMRLRNIRGKYTQKSTRRRGSSSSGSESSSDVDSKDAMSSKEEGEEEEEEEEADEGLLDEGGNNGETWNPSVEGFVKYLVDSKLIFNTIERIVDESNHVSYAYFRKTGLERAEGLSKDLEWFSQQNVAVPEPSKPGISYSKYLEELGEKSPPLFLSHFYNVYFSHIAGGQVIVNQVSQKILAGRTLEFCQWEGDVQELLKGVREKLNILAEHWTRDDKSKCLKEAKKSFHYMGQIIRLIIL